MLFTRAHRSAAVLAAVLLAVLVAWLASGDGSTSTGCSEFRNGSGEGWVCIHPVP